MIKLIIFDLDGPILDSFEQAKKAILATREKLLQSRTIEPERLPEVTKESLMSSWGYPADLTVNKIFPALGPEEIIQYMQVWAASERSDEKIKLIEGAAETVKLLKEKGYFMGILTSRSRNLELHLKDLDVSTLFSFIQSWHNPALGEPQLICQNHRTSDCHKPDPEVFKEILLWAEGQNIKKEEMVLIDDTLVGLNAARGVKMPFIGVCTGPMDSKEKWLRYGNLELKYIINSIAELPDWLEKYGRVR